MDTKIYYIIIEERVFMDKEKVGKILDKNCRVINISKICGVNKECIREYIQKILMLDIV